VVRAQEGVLSSHRQPLCAIEQIQSEPIQRKIGSLANIWGFAYLCAVLQEGEATGVHLVGTRLVGQLPFQHRAEAVNALHQGLCPRYGPHGCRVGGG
jgi:hypothetical protein